MARLPKVNLFEIEDQRWLPASIRDAITSYLSWLGSISPAPYREFASALSQAMRRTGDTAILDLCSGGSGGWSRLLPLLDAENAIGRFGGDTPPRCEVLMTDLYPNLPAMRRASVGSGDRIRYSARPVDATRVPVELGGFRVILNAFHHFRPPLAKEILRNACRHRRGIAVFEGVERSVASILACLTALGLVPLSAPFIRPLTVTRIALTYAVPALPLLTAWDGVASSLRCYTAEELLTMAHEVEPDYVWTAKRSPLSILPIGTTYLIGHPPATEARQIASGQ